MNELSRVVHVEDELDIREITNIALQAIGGFKVESFPSGAEAVAKAAAFAPDLLLLDVMMPNMDGPTVLKALRAIPQLSETPAVFMTAKALPTELDRLLNCGAVAVITKPFDPATLSDQLRAIWRKAQPSSDNLASG